MISRNGVNTPQEMNWTTKKAWGLNINDFNWFVFVYERMWGICCWHILHDILSEENCWIPFWSSLIEAMIQ